MFFQKLLFTLFSRMSGGVKTLVLLHLSTKSPDWILHDSCLDCFFLKIHINKNTNFCLNFLKTQRNVIFSNKSKVIICKNFRQNQLFFAIFFPIIHELFVVFMCPHIKWNCLFLSAKTIVPLVFFCLDVLFNQLCFLQFIFFL